MIPRLYFFARLRGRPFFIGGPLAWMTELVMFMWFLCFVVVMNLRIDRHKVAEIYGVLALAQKLAKQHPI
ncbi:hypothetical protein [Serratia ficaria]|uniref:hypothetical protein n=1 Tax=Serratia ficaria TaxID=61651 RepID=UPI00077C904D|nr:hypothetical protein [Serratia ficaria]